MAKDWAAALENARAREQAGRLAAAVAAYRDLLAHWPDCAPGWFHLGAALYAQDRRREAIEAWREAIRQAPDLAEAHVNLSIATLGEGDVAAAAAAAETALRCRPGWMPAQAALAKARRRQGEDQLAAGNALYAEGRFAAAAACYRAALAVAPAMAEAEANLCAALQATGDLAGAIAAGEAALRLAPGFAEAAANLGNAKLTVGDFAGAEQAYRQALAHRTEFPAAWSNLGAALRDQGRLDEAEAACRAALALAPHSAAAHYNLALVLLTAGRYREGWAEHEWRWRTGTMAPRDFPCPPWRGEGLAGRRILLHAEQGLGDTLQFVRYVPLIAAMGADVVLEVQAPLKRLLAEVAGVAAIHACGEALPACDYHAPLMSLPHRLGTELATVPAQIPYLPRPAPLFPGLADAREGLRVGLVWAGDPRPGEPRAHFADRRRSLPLVAFAPLAEIRGIRLVSLQKGAAATETPPPGLELEAALDSVRDFADTAAVIMGLDLVISVDTSVAHLAGGLGKPVWLLSRFDGCWRWLAGRDDSPWYPTLRLYRQTAPGAWAAVITRVTADLGALACGQACPAQTGLVSAPALV